jgi:hypothetical protein
MSTCHSYICTFCRNLCARDWCAEHPDGTAAEFKYYYDHGIPSNLKKVGLVIPNCANTVTKFFGQTYEKLSKEAKAREAAVSLYYSQCYNYIDT